VTYHCFYFYSKAGNNRNASVSSGDYIWILFCYTFLYDFYVTFFGHLPKLDKNISSKRNYQNIFIKDCNIICEKGYETVHICLYSGMFSFYSQRSTTVHICSYSGMFSFYTQPNTTVLLCICLYSGVCSFYSHANTTVIIKIIIITKNLYCATKCRCKLSSANLSATEGLGAKQVCLQHTLETQQRDWELSCKSLGREFHAVHTYIFIFRYVQLLFPAKHYCTYLF